MADLHLRRRLPDAMHRRFDHVVSQYLAYSERVLLQHSDNLLHGNGGGAVFANAPKMLHQPVEFFQRRPAVALATFSDQPELLEDGNRVIEFLA